MPGWRGLRWVAGCWLFCLTLGGVAQASDPALRLVVPFGPGGASDVLFREVGRALERELGSSIRYDNQPGHSGMRGALLVKEAPPDGRTLLGSHQTLILARLSDRSSLSHEAFTPMALLMRTVNIPAARRQVGVASATELVARLRAEDAVLRVGMIPDSTDAFFWRQFLQAAGLSQEVLTWVGYPDTGSQVAALLGGEIDLAMLNLPAGRRLFDHGALVPLGGRMIGGFRYCLRYRPCVSRGSMSSTPPTAACSRHRAPRARHWTTGSAPCAECCRSRGSFTAWRASMGRGSIFAAPTPMPTIWRSRRRRCRLSSTECRLGVRRGCAGPLGRRCWRCAR